MGQILQPSSCCIVCLEKNNFGLQFFEGLLLSENKTTSLSAVIASLCWSCYKCSQILQKMQLHIQNDRDILETGVWYRRMVKDVTDMQSNLTTENKPIPISMISVLLLCISSKRSQHSSWLSRIQPCGFQILLAKINVT
jgi:hypothetical protein